MNYYKRYLGDYAKDTRTLTTYEHGVYTLLLDLYYSEEKGFTVSDANMVCRPHGAKEKASILKILERFFILNGEIWTNRRADEEIAAYKEKSEQNQKIGRLGGLAKAKHKASETLSETLSGTLTETVSEAISHSHIPEKEQDQKKGRASAPACPSDVPETTWFDWLALRKAKRAPVSETVVERARAESAKAGMPFADFLAEWCERGSQGLKAEWINAGRARGSPSVAQQFAAKTYTGTPDDELPSYLKP